MKAAQTLTDLADFARTTWERQRDLLDDAAADQRDALQASHDIWVDISYRTAEMTHNRLICPPSAVINAGYPFDLSEIVDELAKRKAQLQEAWHKDQGNADKENRFRSMRDLWDFWNRHQLLNQALHQLAKDQQEGWAA